jgi:uncharacterized damage-inducible protein DinB
MTGPRLDAERAALGRFLNAQRSSALAIIDGMTEEDLRRPVVPSGWTPLGIIEHLGDAESFWFQQVVAGRTEQPDGTADGGHGPFETARPVEQVVARYRARVARADEILAASELDEAPAVLPPPDLVEGIDTVRDVVLHLIEETARHAGHLDIARELLTGRTGLGPR